MRTLALPLDTAYALFATHYNPRCIPPWSEREIWHKLEQARDHGRFELLAAANERRRAAQGRSRHGTPST